jgi:hypothetical protein
MIQQHCDQEGKQATHADVALMDCFQVPYLLESYADLSTDAVEQHFVYTCRALLTHYCQSSFTAGSSECTFTCAYMYAST